MIATTLPGHWFNSESPKTLIRLKSCHRLAMPREKRPCFILKSQPVRRCVRSFMKAATSSLTTVGCKSEVPVIRVCRAHCRIGISNAHFLFPASSRPCYSLPMMSSAGSLQLMEADLDWTAAKPVIFHPILWPGKMQKKVIQISSFGVSGAIGKSITRECAGRVGKEIYGNFPG